MFPKTKNPEDAEILDCSSTRLKKGESGGKKQENGSQEVIISVLPQVDKPAFAVSSYSLRALLAQQDILHSHC